MPTPGANIRLYTVALSPPRSCEKRNTPDASTRAARKNVSMASKLLAALSTARRVASGMKRNATPHETTCTGRPVPATAACGNPRAPAAPAGSAIGSENVGSCCVIEAKLRSLPRHVRATEVGPRPRPNTKFLRAGSSTPVRASAKALPIVGCPAIGISALGVKIRSRKSVPRCSGGRMKVVSEKFISLAIACMALAARPRPSRNTASGLPPKSRSVKTS